MIDSLSPLFTDRNTRLAAFPDEQRLAFQALEKSSGDPMFADRQLASIWMGKRTGLTQAEVLKNFDGLASRYFGEGATATQAYDRISELYKAKPEVAPAQGKEGAPQSTESPYSVSGTVISKDVAGSLAGGASRMGYDTLGGFYANLASATGVRLKRPQDDPEYQELDRRRILAEDPTAFTQVYDEVMTFRGAVDEDAMQADYTRMMMIRERVQAENMAALDAASGTFIKSYSDDARKIADTMYGLSKASLGAFGVREEFQSTAIGGLLANAGSLPVTALMAAMGPILGPSMTFTGIYAQVEQERMQVEGKNYDPTRAWLQNLASAGPQAAMEYAFGVEHAMEKIIHMTPKVGGKIMFGDAARLMAKTGLASGIEEGITEPIQGFWNDWTASLSYDEQRQLFTEEKIKERLLESVSAFSLGFLFGGGVQGLEILDRNKAVSKSERFLLTREGKPIDGPDFAALRTVKTDEELRAMAPNGLGDMLVGAANGNVGMQIAYRQETLRQAFVDTDGMTVQGLTIGKIGDEVGLRNEAGQIIVIDQNDPQQVSFLKELQAEAVARDATTQATIDEMKRRFNNLLEVEKRELPVKLSELRKKGLITREQEADALAAAVYINEALSEDATDALVMGSAKLTQSETDNILRMVINVAQGADPTVAVEELAEAWKKKGIVEGKLDELKLRAYREQWHKDNNESDPAADGRVTPERADTEWFSKRVVEYALANRKTELPGGWGDWLRTLGERLRKLLQGATRMKKMLREGKISPELEGWFREALGAGQGSQSNAATFSLSGTDNQNLGDTTFSLGRAVTAAELKQDMSIINPNRTAAGRVKVFDLATALDKLAKGEGYHRPANDLSDKAISQAAEALATDLADMLTRNSSGIGWYDRKVRSAMELLARVHPEIATDKEAQLRFKVMLAAISQGNSVDINFRVAEKAYREFKETGKLPTWPYPGKSDGDIRNTITRLFNEIKTHGADKVMEIMTKRMTVKEWNKLGYEVSSELAATEITGAMAIMGSKIGSFFGNLNGDFTTLTADLWFSRTWNRIFGNMAVKADPNLFDDLRATLKATNGSKELLGYKKSDLLKDDEILREFAEAKSDQYAEGNYKDKTPLNVKANTVAKKLAGEMNDVPRNGSERNAMRKAVDQAIDLLEQQGFPRLTVADAQAIIWYAEKDLFSAFKAVNKSGEKVDYEVAAQQVVGSYGIDNRVSDEFARYEPPAIPRGDRSSQTQPRRLGKAQRSRATTGVSFSLTAPIPAPVFYSRLIRTVEQSTQGKANGAQWKATIKNSKLGVNQDEFALVGVQDLEDGKTYTKQEVLDYLKANEITVQDVTLGGGEHVFTKSYPTKEELMAVVNNDDTLVGPDGQLVDGLEVKQMMGGWNLWDTGKGALGNTHFSTYQLPGAIQGSYREVLLTVPKISQDRVVYIGEDKSAAYLAGKKTGEPFVVSGPSFDGSDKNYTVTVSSKNTGWKDGHDKYHGIDNPVVRIRLNERNTSDGKRMLFLEEVQGPQKPEFKKMPELFQKNWRDIGFKWALRKAVEGGFDALGWTTGQQQADRYNLSKQVDTLFVDRTSKGGYSVQMRTVGSRYFELVGTPGMNADELAATIGKDLAQKVVENGGDKRITFTGEGLKVGGEGLIKLYDSDFRNVVNGLAPVKKSGQKVSRSDIITSKAAMMESPINGDDTPVLMPEQTKTVNSLEINDAIAASVMGGQPTFSLAQVVKTERIQIKRLEQRIDAMYSTGRTNGVEDLEAQLEMLQERVATDMEAMQEGDTNIESAPSAEEELISAWFRWNGIGLPDNSQDLKSEYKTFGEFVRATTGDTQYNISPNTTDAEIEAAAKEAADQYDRRRNALRKQQTFALTSGTPASRKFAAIYAKQAAMFPYPYHRISSTPTQTRVSLGGHEAGLMGRMLLPVSERLRFIADRAGSRTGILYRARRYYSEKGTNLKRYSDQVIPLMRGLAKMSTQDMQIFKAAASNQDALQRNNVISKYGLQSEWAAYEAARDSLRAEMIAAGIDVGDIGEYFPRWVKDVTGLRESFGMDASDQPLVQAVIDAEKKAGRALTDEEVNAVLDGAIRGVRSNVTGGAKPANTKERKIVTIADTQLDFYADPNHALSRWLNQSTEAIARYRFFGKDGQPSTVFPSQIDLDVSIGSILREEVASGNLAATAQMEVKAMLDGLFGYHGKTNGYIRGFMDLSYWATMGKLSSALAQAVDVTVSVYEAGPWNTAMAVSESMFRNAKNLPGIGNSKTMSEAVANFTKGKNWLTREDLGVDRIMDEFNNQSFTTAALNQVFTATGLNFMDGIGKDTLLNAKFQQLAKQAKRSAGLSASNQKMLEQIFGKAKARQVIADFRAGIKNADTIFTVYNVLADWQPISLLEYPEVYAKNPNGRVLYMLKSYSIKMLAAYKREGYMKMWYGSPEQKVEGARNIAYLLAMLFMAGVSKDWLVDFLLDRDPQLEDVVVDNVFKLAQVSRYALWQQRNRAADMGVYGGVDAAARIGQNTRQILTDMIAPPSVLIERPAKDLGAWAKAKANYEPWSFWASESVQFIPIAGEIIYWTGPTGQAKIERRRKLRDQ